MSKLLMTVDDLVDEVRSLLDEENTDSVSTTRDILPALNRAQEYAWDTYSRKYPDALVKIATLDLTAGTQDYTIPEDCYQDKIIDISIVTASNSNGKTLLPVERIGFKEAFRYESTNRAPAPQWYYTHRRNIRMIPTPGSTYDARISYIQEPDKLVVNQGRITTISVASNYINVDEVGSDVLTSGLSSYLNIVDGQTGEIKQTLQVSSTSGTTITFRSSPQRSSVLGRSISSSIDTDVELDDYVCLVQGTCVPYFSSPTTNFLVQFAVMQIAPRKGDASGLEEDKLLDRFEKQIESSWAGREPSMRIQAKSSIWK